MYANNLFNNAGRQPLPTPNRNLVAAAGKSSDRHCKLDTTRASQRTHALNFTNTQANVKKICKTVIGKYKQTRIINIFK